MNTGRTGRASRSVADIELKEIRHAIAVAEHGSVAAAATALHLSQSSLSRSIVALEAHLGGPLFRRTRGGVAATDLGRLLVERGQAMLDAAADMQRLLVRHPVPDATSLVIGIGATVSEAAVADAAARMLREMPAVTLELRSSVRDDLVPALRQGELDLLIASPASAFKDADHVVDELAVMPMIVLVHRGHRLAGRLPLDARELFGHPVLVGGALQPQILDGLLREQSRAADPADLLRPMPALSTGSLAVMLELLQRLDGVAATSPALAERLVEQGRLVPLAAPPWLLNPYALVRPRARATNPALDAFCRYFRQIHEAEVARAWRLVDLWLPDAEKDARAAMSATADP